MNRFLTGALLGLVAGLLIAPQKGEDLREDIVDAADRWKDKFNRMVGRAETNLEDLKGLLDREVDGLSEDVRHRILTIIDEAEEMAYNAKTQLSGGIA
ncbi:MAG TPA: YtxH domain-containing protein [Flavipsychrobacter sp.]|nr:YtxH domain-containing protein [Flavipsychrobacter sp.]